MLVPDRVPLEDRPGQHPALLLGVLDYLLNGGTPAEYPALLVHYLLEKRQIHVIDETNGHIDRIAGETLDHLGDG